MSNLIPDETILGLLAVRARHGYELLNCFRDPAQLGHVWNLSTSQLYNVLKRLEREALIFGCEVDGQHGPRRVKYRLSDSGCARLDTWLYESNPSPSVRRVRVEFLSRLYIARALKLPTGEIVRNQRSVCERERERLLTERRQVRPGMETLAIDFVIEQLDAVLRWIAGCENIPAHTED